MKQPETAKAWTPSLLSVVPCYNEEEVLARSGKILADVLQSMQAGGKVSSASKILFVDDGSQDSTWDIINHLHKSSEIFAGISLAHNAGHQNALMAGLMRALDAGYDITISIDADLQDDPGVMEEMVDKYLQGAQIVYGIRENRDTDTAFKRNTAAAFYRMMKRLGVEEEENCADFRLMSYRALRALSQYRESNLYLRGIVPALGFKTDRVYYSRKERTAGESKYPLPKMLHLAMDGLTSFSLKPMELILRAGILSLGASVLVLAASLIWGVSLYKGFMAFSLWAAAGLILSAIGILGQYTGRTYMEAKRRPRYIIDEETGLEKQEGNIFHLSQAR